MIFNQRLHMNWLIYCSLWIVLHTHWIHCITVNNGYKMMPEAKGRTQHLIITNVRASESFWAQSHTRYTTRSIIFVLQNRVGSESSSNVASFPGTIMACLKHAYFYLTITRREGMRTSVVQNAKTLRPMVPIWMSLTSLLCIMFVHLSSCQACMLKLGRVIIIAWKKGGSNIVCPRIGYLVTSIHLHLHLPHICFFSKKGKE